MIATKSSAVFCILVVCLLGLPEALTIKSGHWSISEEKGQATAVNPENGQQVQIFKDVNTKSQAAKNNGQWLEESFQMLSIVGSIISYKRVYYAEGGAHPSYGTEFKSVDLDKGGAAISLRDIFPDRAILDSLLRDKVIKSKISAKPDSLNELFELIDGGCELNLSSLILRSFAFHHVNGGLVAVRIGVGPGCELNRGNFTQLGIYLPIPSKWANEFNAAVTNGTLMQQLVPAQNKAK